MHKIITIIALIIAALAVGWFMFMPKPNPTLPSNIQSKLNFSPLIIPNSDKYKSQNFSLEPTETEKQVLVYDLSTPDFSITISQYPQPPQFTDIPEYKDRFLSNIIKQTSTVQSSSGVIYLGRQEKNNNHQLGVMMEKGLLIFMNPTNDLTESQWRLLADQFEIQKIN